MNLRLALVVQAGPQGCAVRWLDEDGLRQVGYSAPVLDRIKIRPSQLVVVDEASAPPTIVWRWFRGQVVYRAEDHVVVDNRIYQPGARIPISVARLPHVLEVDVAVGDEVFYTIGPDAVVVDVAVDGRPPHAERIAADLFPAVEDFFAELAEQEGA